MAGHHVRLVLDQISATCIEVDGRQLDGVRGLTLRAGVGQLTELELDLVIEQIETVAGEVHTVITTGAAETLKALGWTPPARQADG